ncbi:patatin-like phospholipase family protein [Pontibacter sp. 13R65]|uniref:patatin-like phospholipase family protein n=1 Tax=Pontibacter sp. 13R65 TaxID=3127458 RepID=UPI00301C4186
MKTEDFTINNGSVQKELEDLRENLRNKQFSDVVDDEGNQYVDLVMEGGGMLGIALVGYVYTLEQVGIRFLQLGGTSAGSINALLMAAAGPKNKPSTDWLLEILASKNFYDFVDGDSDAKDFIKAVTSKSRALKLAWKGAQVIDNIREDFGLNPGHNFHGWMTELLKTKNVDTLAKLKEMRQQGNDLLKLRDGQPYTSEDIGRFALVAADITTQTKVNFPEMADLYWANPDQVNPADFVRASMSIPLFFHPYRITNLPFGEKQLQKWRNVGYFGNVPDEIFFIDGGINSNFPIDLFHNHNRVPNAPTFGVKLGVDRHHPRIIRKVPDLLGAIFDSARQTHDFDFIARNPDYKHLVHCLDTDTFNWLDFNMPDTEKRRLFELGVRGAATFLTKFNWEKYKELRKALVGVNQTSADMDAASPAPKPLLADLNPN